MATDVAKLNVSELDMPTIKANLIAYLKSQSEFANYDFAGSGIDVILDLLSYNTYYNSFYLNMISNEMFLETAELRNSVVQRAKQMGYTPASVQGSKAEVIFEFSFFNSRRSFAISALTPFIVSNFLTNVRSRRCIGYKI